MSMDSTRHTQKVRQASTLSETCRAGTTSHTNKQSDTTEEMETEEMLNAPDTMLEYMHSSFEEQEKPATRAAKARAFKPNDGNMVHTAVLTHARNSCWKARDLKTSHYMNMFVTLAYFRRG